MSSDKNIILLSEKSSGSSACQNLLAKFANIRHVEKTRHFENETLYWLKAASVLGMPQIKMVDSEVPIPADKAREDLITLLKENLDSYTPPDDDKALITQGWRSLCKHYSPIFFEKSPHHLCQWSALELIVENIKEIEDVDFLLVGLVRNPMDTIYSQFKRWKSPPEKVEQQWLTAYRNLLKLQEIEGIPLVVIRYEDIVSSLKHLEPVLDFCGVKASVDDEKYLHRKSLSKWKTDKIFGFALSEETIQLAEKFGYEKKDLVNELNPFWGVFSNVARVVYLSLEPVKRVIRKKFR